MAGDDTTAAAPTPSLSALLSSALPSVLSRAKVITSPYPFKLAEDDSLRVVVLNAAPGAVVNVQGRLVEPGQDPRPFDFIVTPTSDRAVNTQDQTLNAGLVTNLTVFVSGAAPLYGQTFVILQLIRSTGATAYVMGTLLAGYVTATQALGWPGSAIQNSVTDGGYYRMIAGTAPALGTEILETCPVGARWDLISANLTINCGATVAARFARLFINNSGRVPFFAWPDNQVSASAVQNLVAAAVAKQTSVNGASSTYVWLPLPSPCTLLAGDFFTTLTTNLQADDRWSQPTYLVREWLEA